MLLTKIIIMTMFKIKKS